MKKTIIIALILTALCSASVYANKLEKPNKVYTQEEIREKIKNSEEIAYIDLFSSEKEDTPMAMALESVTSASYYDQLTPYEQELYKFYEENAKNFRNGTGIKTPASGTSSQDSYYRKTLEIPITLGSGEKLTEENWLSKMEEAMGVNVSTLLQRSAYAYFWMDHPEVFWVDLNNTSFAYGHLISGNSVIFVTELKPRQEYKYFFPSCYDSPADVEKDDALMESKVNEILEGMPRDASDFCKVKYITEWLCLHNKSYNYAAAETKDGLPAYHTDPTLRYAFIAPSALLYGDGDDTKKYPVCEGYSEAFKILCNRAGVDSMCITSAGHKWNGVKIKDKFYFSDPTWCDTGDNRGIKMYSWMLVGTEKAKVMDSGKDHDIAYQVDLKAPDISNTMYIEDMGFPVCSAGNKLYNYLDVDQNGSMNVDDISGLLKQAADIDEKTATDLDNNGVIDILDSIKLLRLFFTQG